MKIKVIDLLNKIANGEEVPKKIRIDHWCYKFEWVEHDSNYYDKHNEIDLMSCLSCDKEELNYEVHEIEEEKKIPKKLGNFDLTTYSRDDEDLGLKLNYTGVSNTFNDVYFKINSIIDYLKSKGEK